MLISCKCLNFIATSNKNQQSQQQQFSSSSSSSPPLQHQLQQLQKSIATGNAATADAPTSPFKLQKPPHNTAVGNEWCNNNNNLITEELMQAFLQKYPRNFIFYSQCMDFFKQAIGPFSDLTINAVNQRDIIYSLTLEVQQQSWQISFCINCNSALCAKRLQIAASSPNGSATSSTSTLPLYFINGALQTTNDELSHRRAERSFSETFGILIMDHPESELMQHSGNVTPTVPNGNSVSSSLNIGSLNTLASMGNGDPKQQRLRQLQQHLQQRLQREIVETDERIQRYTEQQFALLRSYREKSEQEFELLARLIQRVPEQVNTPQHNGCGLDRIPPALDVSEGVSYVARRRNTITGRRDLNNGGNVGNAVNGVAPTTPTSPFAPINFNITTTQQQHQQQKTAINSAIDVTTTTSIIKNYNNNNTQQNNGATTTVTVIKANNNNRRMSNFDTPPATPEAMPMSVGSSPTFQQEVNNLNGQIKSSQQLKQPHVKKIDMISDKKQQQQQMSLPIQSTYIKQQQQQQHQQHQQQQQSSFNNVLNDTLDADCLFEWDGDEMESANTDYYSPNATLQSSTMYQQQQQHAQLYQRSMSIASNHQDNTMSDLDDSDGAEEAEDAIDLDSSQPIPMHSDGRGSLISDRLNFGKSLPIDIANSPMMESRNNYMNGTGIHEEDLECTLDIAASIKALAKSVHGEAVFGDLPRPRLRSQI